MTQPARSAGEHARIYTADDWLHDRRRRMAEPFEPVQFEQERLKRLQERSRDTRDP